MSKDTEKVTTQMWGKTSLGNRCSKIFFFSIEGQKILPWYSIQKSYCTLQQLFIIMKHIY